MSPLSRHFLRSGAIAATLLTLITTGCTKAEWMVRQSAMDPKGPLSQMQFDTFMDTVWLSLVIFVIVGGAFIIAVVMFREKPEHANQPVPKQGHGNPLIEIGVIMVSIFSLVLVAVPTMKGIWLMYDESPEQTYRLNGESFDRVVSAEASALKKWFPYTRDELGNENYSVADDNDVLEITVVGKQWWFRFEYPQFGLVSSPLKDGSVANEFVIPAGRVVRINLRSDDVIHSFWLPKVAGKVDLVPGRRNSMWIQADQPGHYYGQCAEYCGDSHAYMLFRVEVVSDEEFKNWIAAQKAEAIKPTSALALQGEKLFKEKTCVMCHTVAGLAGATGSFGPNLTHVGSRKTLAGAWMFNYDDKIQQEKEKAAGNTEVTPVLDEKILKENLVKWIGSSGMNHQISHEVGRFGEVKPGNRMHHYSGMFNVTGLRPGLLYTGKFTEESLNRIVKNDGGKYPVRAVELAKRDLAFRVAVEPEAKAELALNEEDFKYLSDYADAFTVEELKAMAEYLAGLK